MTERNREDGPRDPELSRRYRESAQEAPSAETDQRILEAAREAVSDEGKRARHGTAPIGMAALVLLSAALVVQLLDTPRDDPQAETADEPATQATAPQRSAPAAASKGAAAAEAPADSGASPADADRLAREAEVAELTASKPARAVASRAATADETPGRAPTIAEIRSAWEAGDTDSARVLLRRYIEANPETPETVLRRQLPDALLQEAAPEN